MCHVCLLAGVEPDPSRHSAVCKWSKDIQSVLDVDFVWQSPAFCGVPGLLWGEFQVQAKSP